MKELKIGTKSIRIVDVMVLSGLAKSKSEAKRLIRQGAVRIYRGKK